MSQLNASAGRAHRESVSANRLLLTSIAFEQREQSCSVHYFVRSALFRGPILESGWSQELCVGLQSVRGECTGRFALLDVAGLHTGLARSQAPIIALVREAGTATITNEFRCSSCSLHRRALPPVSKRIVVQV